ncbi:MAG: hypothetical protein D8M59_05800 [Planctomycetes bacterium]|nr:hypothetical protein [Planctomycetota bacterium]
MEVTVELTAAGKGARILISGIPCERRYMQFNGVPGQRVVTVVVTQDEQVESRTLVVDVVDAPPLPQLVIRQDPHAPYLIQFDLVDESHAPIKASRVDWLFGDGSQLMDDGPLTDHDYRMALDMDSPFSVFNVTAMYQLQGGSRQVARRTLAIANLDPVARRLGFVQPYVEQHPEASYIEGARPGWRLHFDIHHRGPKTLRFDKRRIQFLDRSGESAGLLMPTTDLATPIIVEGHDNQGSAQETVVQVEYEIPIQDIPAGAFGYAVHLIGHAENSGLKAYASGYCEFASPTTIHEPLSAQAAQFMERRTAGVPGPVRVSQTEILDEVRRGRYAYPDSLRLMSVPAPRGETESRELAAGASARNTEALREVVRPNWVSYESEYIDCLQQSASRVLAPWEIPVTAGDPADPFSPPVGTLAPQVVPGEPEWLVEVPGRFLNAFRGNTVLSPASTGPVAEMFKQLSPVQIYSHSVLMTEDFFVVRHSTASQTRMTNEAYYYEPFQLAITLVPYGTIADEQIPQAGFRPDVVQYGWPGTVSQTAQLVVNGELMKDPEQGGMFEIEGMLPYPGNLPAENGTPLFAPAMVVKPAPDMMDATTIKRMNDVADMADQIRGHYRFYSYSEAGIIDDPGKLAPEESGWAYTCGPLPTVCSSLIWQAARMAGVRLEGPGAYTQTNDLEPSDIWLAGSATGSVTGAEVDARTLDGLYLYQEDERLAASNTLWAYINDQVFLKNTGFAKFADIFNDMGKEIADQFVNCFAVDSCEPEGPALWKQATVGHAVSPDDILRYWDAPHMESGQHVGLYGYFEPLVYLPEYKKRETNPTRWMPVTGRTGTVEATVMLDGFRYRGALVRLLGQQAWSDDEGVVRFTIPEAANPYVIKAQTTLAKFQRSSEARVLVVGNEVTRIELNLRKPDANYRLVTMAGTMEVWESGTFEAVDYMKFPITASTTLDPDIRLSASITADNEPIICVLEDVKVKLFMTAELQPDRSVLLRWRCEHWDGSGNPNSYVDLYGEKEGVLLVPEDQSGTISFQMSWYLNPEERLKAEINVFNQPLPDA